MMIENILYRIRQKIRYHAAEVYYIVYAYAIVYDMQHAIIYYILYHIVYDIVYDIHKQVNLFMLRLVSETLVAPRNFSASFNEIILGNSPTSRY